MERSYKAIIVSISTLYVGYKMIGVDIDANRIEKLKKGEVPFYEPGLKEGLDSHKDRIEYTVDSDYAVKNADTLFLTVGTPLLENDHPDFSQIDASIESIGKNIRPGQLIVLKSTVVIGTTEERVAPMLEKFSGMKVGTDFFLAFCPERTIEGLALHEIYHLPKIIGGVNKESSIKADKILRRLGGKTTVVSSPRVAEMCKLVDNLYRATNIAFANELGMLCEKMNIDAREVASAVNNSYPRTTIFTPGLGADGPCLSKDPLIFKHSAMKHNVLTPLVDGCVIQNKFSTMRIANMVKDHILKNNLNGKNLAILGLAFKGFPETDDLRGSPAKKILDSLNKEGIKFDSVRVYDPLVKNFMNYQISKNIYHALEGSNIILFLTNHPKIMNIDLDHILDKIKKPALILDAWGNLNIEDLPEGIDYFRIGNGVKKSSRIN
ncbi:MAG: UDP-glucose 6-dehydrogenase [Candidatus Magasanikbacteria bacterium GW2011_GWA2_43_9]|nr:MAG: UDP-glucose 6-dehydrogenase [Candidatus Magasanikbacteria bacterium GW2011_GWA2_43_9]